MALKLYANESNNRLDKVLIVAKYTGHELERVKEFDPKSPEFLSKNPTGKLPVVEVEGEFLAGSNAIIRYLGLSGEQGVYGTTNLDSGLIDQWIDFSAEVELAAYAWLLTEQKVVPNNPAATKKAQEDIKKIFQILENHLQTRTYLVGNYISLADIAFATSLQKLYELVLDPVFRGPFINTNRWYNTILNQPNVKAVIPEVKIFPGIPEPEEEEEEQKEEKVKNPLDALPKSSFILDEWKRKYSNNDTRAVAIPWFYEKFDKDGFSIWWCDFRYNDELEKTFMTANRIGGFFQRLEKLHKYAFGSMLIFGEEGKGNQSVAGVWVFRGTEVPEDMKLCDDYEHYNWKRVDLNNEEEKKLFEDYLAWDGHLGGRKFLAGKTFK